MLTAEQCRAARALLNWTQPALAKAAGVSESTVFNLETRRGKKLSSAALGKIRKALEDAGVEIIEPNGGGAGARLKRRRR